MTLMTAWLHDFQTELSKKRLLVYFDVRPNNKNSNNSFSPLADSTNNFITPAEKMYDL